MYINETIISRPLENLYNEVNELMLLNNKIVKIMVEEINDPQLLEMGAGGYCRFDSIGNLEIKCNDDEYIEYNLSHELLHALLKLKGYPNIILNKDIHEWEAVHYFGNMLHNIIEHKLIIREQEARKIDIKKKQEIYLNKIKEFSAEEYSEAVIVIISWFIELNTQISNYEEYFKSKFKISMQLYEFIMGLDYSDPFSTRKATVKLYREFDRHVKPSLDLTSKVGIDFIPSSRQLGLKLPQVFIIREEKEFYPNSNNHLFLFSIADSQLSFMYELDDSSERGIQSVKSKLINMTVEEFYKSTERNYHIR